MKIKNQKPEIDLDIYDNNHRTKFLLNILQNKHEELTDERGATLDWLDAILLESKSYYFMQYGEYMTKIPEMLE